MSCGQKTCDSDRNNDEKRHFASSVWLLSHSADYDRLGHHVRPITVIFSVSATYIAYRRLSCRLIDARQQILFDRTCDTMVLRFEPETLQ